MDRDIQSCFCGLKGLLNSRIGVIVASQNSAACPKFAVHWLSSPILIYAVLMLAISVAFTGTRSLDAQTIDANYFAKLQQLDSPMLPIRNNVEEQLTMAGADFLGWLATQDRASLALSSEATYRLQRITSRIFDQRLDQFAESSSLNVSSGLSATELSKAINRQTNNQLNLRPNVRITSQAASQKFWPWVQRFADRHRLTLSESEGQLNLLPVEAWPSPLQSVSSGPLLAQLDPSAINETGSVVLQIFWEPRLSPISIKVPFADLQLSSADNQPWAEFNRDAILAIPARPKQVRTQFRLPVRRTSKVELQSAKVDIQLAALAPTTEMQIDNVLAGRDDRSLTHSAGMLIASVENVERNAKQVNIRLLLEFDADRMALPLQSHVGWSQFCDAKLLEDDTSQEFLPSQVRQIAVAPYQLKLEYTFDTQNNLTSESQATPSFQFVFQSPCGILAIQETVTWDFSE